MCGRMVDIQSATAEIRRGKKKKIERKNRLQDKNIMSASATQGGHNNYNRLRLYGHISRKDNND